MRDNDIDIEIERRARRHLGQSHLVADYYRIRRKVAYPLPIRSLHIPEMPVPGIDAYPWSIWMLWDLEERIHSLGWLADRTGDEAARSAVLADVEALAEWPTYRQFERPDLSLGHCGRLLWYAATSWNWVREALGKSLTDACEGLVEDGLPYSDELHQKYDSKDRILAHEEPHTLLHNIPFIGTVGIALCADLIEHTSRERVNDRLEALFTAILDLRADGHSEGVGYDGYILDFVAPWLSVLPTERRQGILDHPRFDDVLDESIFLAAPGDPAEVAEIGDVEPREMPYHLSGHARVAGWTEDARRRWLLNRVRLDRLRTDGLAAIRNLSDYEQADEPEGGALDGHYAVCLRSGWERDDLAAAVSASNSPMGHLQCDTGSLVIGTQGRWLIADPGYQQYLKTSERAFTLGEGAHNAPVINGWPQVEKPRSRSLALGQVEEGLWHSAVDLTSCYPQEAGADRVERQIWLVDRDRVVVHDSVLSKEKVALTYHWHGHPDAAWWCESGRAMLYADGSRLWVSCSEADLREGMIDRQSGSRGHLTLTAEVATESVWWIFSVGDPVDMAAEDGGLRIERHWFDPSQRSLYAD